MLSALKKYVTNVTLDNVIDIQRSYKEAVQHVKQIEIKGEDKKTDHI
ncbi:hypothetical protein ACT3UT_00385 [Bacillus spizizenii ATCC 6633 = JCM 2499]|nr:hypothetical protein [Bacillus spizizenii]KFK79291.1 hypothetical protein DJ97_54 [Bacillus spizizenii]MCY7832114.1 hypothetical protein [Bacillus spizizenii]MCY7886966.1 hypothetical protein [Bacillus spizizenii]MCY7887519.1 hypothetical protein [Bacillus spizizenii]MCY8062797.1 hypothetical protein [Bacillus spizizenii]